MGIETLTTTGQQIALVSSGKYHWRHFYGGDKFYTPLYNMNGIANYAYLMSSLPTEKVSASFGVYNEIKEETPSDRTGALLAFKVRAHHWKKNYGYFLTDWSSGATGTYAIGFEWHPGEKWVFTPNYQIGNTGIKNGNHDLGLTVAYNFN